MATATKLIIATLLSIVLVASCENTAAAATASSASDSPATTTFGGSVKCAFHSDGLRGSTLEIPCALASFSSREGVESTDLVVPVGSRNLRYGCDLPEGGAHGMAILVTRGECSFAAKAEQAAKAGASALFIINSDNTIPVVGGRPSVAIPFPVVMVPSSAGRRLRKATKRAGALATVTVFLPPSLALHSLTVTMQPRKCTGAERLAVVAVRSDTTTTGVQALLQTAQLQDVATTVVPDVPTALDYLKRATLPPDVIVFIGTNAASSSHGAAVLAAADRIATAFCAIAKPLVFGKAPGPVSPSAAFPASADLSTFVAFSDVAQAVLTAQQGGVDVGVQLANWTNTTGVDTHAAVFADGTGSSVCELQTAAMEAAVAADGTTTDDLLTTAPIALGPSGSACTRGEGGGGHPSASVPKPGLWRQPRFLSSAPAVLSASDSSTMWEHTWAGNDDHFKSEVAVFFPDRVPDASACARLMAAAINNTVPESALRVYRRCASAHPSAPELLVLMGDVAYVRQDVSEASRWWKLARDHLRSTPRMAHSPLHRRLNVRLRHYPPLDLSAPGHHPSRARSASPQTFGQPAMTAGNESDRAALVGPSSRNRFAVPIAFVHPGVHLPEYLADTLRQAHASNPHSSIVLVCRAGLWPVFRMEAAWLAGRGEQEESGVDPKWLTVVTMDSLADASPTFRFANATATLGYAARQSAEWQAWHGSIERLLAMEACYAAGVFRGDTPVWFMDSDNLLYRDLSVQMKILENDGAGMYAAFLHEHLASTATMFVRRGTAVATLSQWLAGKLLLTGRALRVLRHGRRVDGMALLADYAKKMGPQVLSPLAVGFSTRDTSFEPAVFDAGQWGLFLGGAGPSTYVHPMNGRAMRPGFVDPVAYLEKDFRHRRFKLTWAEVGSVNTRTGEARTVPVPLIRWCATPPPSDICGDLAVTNLRHAHSPHVWALATMVTPRDDASGVPKHDGQGAAQDWQHALGGTEKGRRLRAALYNEAIQYFEEKYDHKKYERW